MPHGLPLTLLIEWTFSPAYRTIAPYSARNQTCISVDTHFNSRNPSVAGLTTTIFQNSRDRRYKEAIQMLIGQFSEINCSTQRKTLLFLFHISMPNTLLRIFVQLFFSGTLSVVRYKKYSKDMIIGCKSIYQRFKTRNKCNMIIFKRKVFSVHSNFVPFLNRNSAANDLLKFLITPLSVRNSRSRLERFTLSSRNHLPEKCVTNTIWLKRTVCCGCICLR